MDEEQLVLALCKLADLADAIVMHPDTIEDLRLYRPLGGKLLLENRDVRRQCLARRLGRAFAPRPPQLTVC